MPQMTVPAIDQVTCSGWNEMERDLYNSLPYSMTEMQLKYFKTWDIWSKLTGSIKWTPNMGALMKRVSKEPSPHIRQFFFPQAVCSLPKKDVIMVRERSVEGAVSYHNFESPIMEFCPSFRDFLKDHVSRTVKDISEKMARANNIFIRGYIFHQSPYVMLANKVDGEVVAAPMGNGDAAGLTGKSTAWLQSVLPLVGNPGNLSVNTINLATNIMETDWRIPALEGSNAPTGDNAVNGRYGLIQSGESFNQFIYDPWVLENIDINLNVITNGWKGDLFGRVMSKLEDMPLRIAADGTFPAPETVELNPDAFNYGESIPNPAYVNAPFEVAFLMGYGKGYSTIEVGPPPKEFANGMPDGFGKMFWNGELIITKNINVPCLDQDNNVVPDTNKYGKYLQIISAATYGCIGEQKRSVLPIIFKRWRGAKNQ